MKTFKYLNKLTVHIDGAFESFYNAMLNDIRLSMFFKSDEQIRVLIQKQKAQFKSSLSMPLSRLKELYIKLGEYHYDIKIPYIDFIKGTEILQEHFLLNTQKVESSVELMDEIFEYFKVMKAYTAKGYLNKMIIEDKRDIESFFEHTTLDANVHLPKALVLEKIGWLKELLISIEKNEDFDLQHSDEFLKQWLDEMEFLTHNKRVFFEELEQRILINTTNLFYFLKREEYLEILPLYTSLLSIYKLTLMMNNAVTIEYANKIIEDMKLDSLTQLFRKDVFHELLIKEMALAIRNNNYYFSVAYIDLDDFKIVNDKYGHLSGDNVIEKMGEVIRNNIRTSDLAFRIGGDEFAIILKSANLEQSKVVCQKIINEFSSNEFIFNQSIKFKVSISIGISKYDIDYKEDFKSLLNDVDNKLYKSKREGKNKITI